jgi:trk system potassium uptake protein TrkH
MISLKKFKEIHLSLNSKIVIFSTFIILFLGSLQFLFGEWNNIYTIYGSPINEKITQSFFHVITRTAGFSLIDYDLVHNSTTFTTIALMLIGGSSLSVAGGIKVGTLTVIIIALISNIRGKEEVTIFKRTISAQVVRRSFVIFVFSIILVSVGFIIMASFEPDDLFKELLFESVSAFGNVGLSTGITKDLNHLSKIILSILMIIGRFGPLLLATLLLGNREQGKIRQPYESVRIG